MTTYKNCKSTVDDVTDKWLMIGNMILAFKHGL